MSEHPIQAMMTTAMQAIKQMIEVNTVIGDPITTEDGSVIIPVTQVSFGFAASGTDLPKGQPQGQGQPSYPFGGGSGGGGKIEPVAFLVVSGGNVRLVPVKSVSGPVEKILDMVPGLVDKANEIIQDYTGKGKRGPEKQKEKPKRPVDDED